ncbi:hypothetical protein D3C77_704180 [compost metagenome]
MIASFASAIAVLVFASVIFDADSILSVMFFVTESKRLSTALKRSSMRSNFASMRIMVSLRDDKADSIESTFFSRRSSRSVMSPPPPPPLP